MTARVSTRAGTGWRPAGAVALSAAFWGLWWLPLRALAEAGLTGAAVNAALYGIASLALLPWYWRRQRRIAAGGLLLLGAGGLFGAALVSWNLALLLGEVVRVTLLFYLAPVWATLLALAVLGERVGWLRMLSVALGLAHHEPLPSEADCVFDGLRRVCADVLSDRQHQVVVELAE